MLTQNVYRDVFALFAEVPIGPAVAAWRTFKRRADLMDRAFDIIGHKRPVSCLVAVGVGGLASARWASDVFRLAPEKLMPLLFHDFSKAMAIMPKDFGVDTMVQMFQE